MDTFHFVDVESERGWLAGDWMNGISRTSFPFDVSTSNLFTLYSLLVAVMSPLPIRNSQHGSTRFMTFKPETRYRDKQNLKLLELLTERV